jgi:hypothetical protein
MFLLALSDFTTDLGEYKDGNPDVGGVLGDTTNLCTVKTGEN